MTNQTFALPLLLATLAMSACVHTPPNPNHASLADECEQLTKDISTLANGSLCYQDNAEASRYFNDLSRILQFNHPKTDQCRQQARRSPNPNRTVRPHNSDLGKLCADTRDERNRLRCQVEAFADSKMAEYAAAEAPKRGISAAELLRQTRAEEAARRARVDTAIRRIEGR
ncbi:hypothetical protein [Eikenella corrodens]|uniref:hypothetical protein n=1 Tax=Eikenella corrodens TaxID=539 RepID=UPI00129AA1D6|nr:hypothetical protein [Eikenella corrodens]